MWIFSHAQPALLYIVPFLLISTLVVGLSRGELGLLNKGIDVELELRGYSKKQHLEEIEYELQEQTEASGMEREEEDSEYV